MVYLLWRLGKPPCTVHIFIPTILLLALFRKEERAFFAQKQELRSNTPCPGSTFSCTDCLVHTNRAGGSPLTDSGFFAEPQLECAAYGGGNVPRPAAGQEGRHQGFYPLNSHFLLGGPGAACRHVTTSKRGTAEEFFYRRGAQCAPLSRHIRSARYRSATHTVYSAQSAA